MGLVVGLILLAIVLGLVGLVIQAVKWLIIIAVIVAVVGLARGALSAGKGRDRRRL